MLPLQKDDVDGGGTTKPNADKITRQKKTKPNTADRERRLTHTDHCLDEDQSGENYSRSVTSAENTEERINQSAGNEVDLIDLLEEQDESVDLQHMFYQPELCPERWRHNLTTAAFQTILANVKDLLSRSPPKNFEFSLPEINANLSDPPKESFHDQFQVTFSLMADEPSFIEEEQDVDQKSAAGAVSPGWDQLFDHAEETKEDQVSLNESVDLFGDDEAFLQMSVPDVQTPDTSTGPEGKQQTPADGSRGSERGFSCSQVGFDHK